jgi:protein ImuA
MPPPLSPASPYPPAPLIAELRRRIAAIETDGAACAPLATPPAPVRLGPPSLDAMLGGGLPPGSLHEAMPRQAGDLGATLGFALAIAARATAVRGLGTILHIHEEMAAREAGTLYPDGLAMFGLAPGALLSLAVRRRGDLLLAMEEGLRCQGLAAVIGEAFPDRRSIGLTASRRLALAAEAGGGIGLLVRAPGADEPGAAVTRWEIQAMPSRSDAFGGLGPAAFAARLTRSKLGRTGLWRLEWSRDEHVLAECSLAEAAVSRAPAALSRHGPDRARRGPRDAEVAGRSTAG